MGRSGRDNEILQFAGCDTVELAKTFGTPLYVVDEAVIKGKCNEIRQEFLLKHNNTKAVYAGKAFLNLAMCKIIEREGFGLDVVSGGELYLALEAGFPMEDVFFHGNNKSKSELRLAISNNIGRIVVDSLYELQLIEDVAKELNKKVKILYRLTPGVNSHTHKHIVTGRADSKFGLPIKRENILEAVKRAIKCKFVELMGFHFHVGSQIFDNKSHVDSVERVANVMKLVKVELGYVTKELNTGGGYGIFYTHGDLIRPINYFTDAIMEKIIEKCETLDLEIPTIIIEPGRWIIGEAGITLYTVGSVKEIPNIKKYAFIDGGMTDNLRPALYDAKYEAAIANKYIKEKTEIITIAGKCCETSDILVKNLKLPLVEKGDILVVFSTGAYNYSMANNYNNIPKAAVVLISDGNAEVIVERENYADLIRKNKLPKHLEPFV